MLNTNRDNLSSLSSFTIKLSNFSLPNYQTFLCLVIVLFIFKISHILIRIKCFCLTRPKMLLLNFWLKYLKSYLVKFLTKLSYEELRNRKLSIKLNLLLMPKLIYFSNPFGLTFILRLNLFSSCMIRCESYFSRLWNTTKPYC